MKSAPPGTRIVNKCKWPYRYMPDTAITIKNAIMFKPMEFIQAVRQWPATKSTSVDKYQHVYRNERLISR
jgi:hypothetical protein